MCKHTYTYMHEHTCPHMGMVSMVGRARKAVRQGMEQEGGSERTLAPNRMLCPAEFKVSRHKKWAEAKHETPV